MAVTPYASVICEPLTHSLDMILFPQQADWLLELASLFKALPQLVSGAQYVHLSCAITFNLYDIQCYVSNCLTSVSLASCDFNVSSCRVHLVMQ